MIIIMNIAHRSRHRLSSIKPVACAGRPRPKLLCYAAAPAQQVINAVCCGTLSCSDVFGGEASSFCAVERTRQHRNTPLGLGRGAFYELTVAQHKAAGAAAEEAVARDAGRGHPKEADSCVQLLELVAGANGVGFAPVGLQQRLCRRS